MELTLMGDDITLRLDVVTREELGSIKEALTKRHKDYFFMKRRMGYNWDGNISFIKNGIFISSGLTSILLKVCSDNGYSFIVHGKERLFRNFDKDSFERWVDSQFIGKYKPRDYQIETACLILNRRMSVAELATSAGKSLIVFMIMGYLIDRNEIDNFLMIVPTISLVEQAVKDFDEYNLTLKSPLFLTYQKISSGEKLLNGCNVTVGTYQSLVRKKKEFFDKFQCVGCDEAHTAKTDSITKILNNIDAKIRFGVSGTIPKEGTLERLTVFSLLGSLVKQIKAIDLMDKGKITPIKIGILEMSYLPEVDRQVLKNISKMGGKETFDKECEYLIHSQIRFDFIANVISKYPKNCLVSFKSLEYGKKFYNFFKLNLKDKEVFYIDGQVKKDKREEIKKEMESGNNKILIASSGTFSTGVSVNNIHAIFLIESFKSETLIRQTIGRGLRLHSEKDFLLFFDFVDDFRTKGFTNFLYVHGLARKKIYQEQSFEYKIKNYDLMKKDLIE